MKASSAVSTLSSAIGGTLVVAEGGALEGIDIDLADIGNPADGGPPIIGAVPEQFGAAEQSGEGGYAQGTVNGFADAPNRDVDRIPVVPAERIARALVGLVGLLDRDTPVLGDPAPEI